MHSQDNKFGIALVVANRARLCTTSKSNGDGVFLFFLIIFLNTHGKKKKKTKERSYFFHICRERYGRGKRKNRSTNRNLFRHFYNNRCNTYILQLSGKLCEFLTGLNYFCFQFWLIYVIGGVVCFSRNRLPLFDFT